MIFEMRGESGETYQFGGTLQPGAKPEDMLTHIADQIAATRRKRPAAKYKVKSIMPGKIPALALETRDFLERAKKMADDATGIPASRIGKRRPHNTATEIPGVAL
jgi:hypothetical protein